MTRDPCRADPGGGAVGPLVRPGDPRDIAAGPPPPLYPGSTADGILAVCRTRVTMVYLLVMGFVGGPFIAYLATSRQIFQDIYDAGDMFVIYFAMGSISALLWGWTEFVGHPGFILFMVWQTSFIFCIGMIFGNVQSLAMEPLGHVAGLAAAIFGAVSTLVSLPLSWLVSGYFDNSIAPLVAGFTIAGAMSLALMRWARRA